uniref:Uncharacterized protein n=1 Tax=Cyanistes caeruleus TaxID=156563 RepID=A0A8C0U7D2_CYACU
MPMTFYFSDTAVLLFDFWNVHSPTGRLPALGLHPSIHPSIPPSLPPWALLCPCHPHSLSQEALTEPQQGDSGPAQGRYPRDPCST